MRFLHNCHLLREEQNTHHYNSEKKRNSIKGVVLISDNKPVRHSSLNHNFLMVTLIHLAIVMQNCMKALVHSILSMRFAAAAAAANSKVAIIVLQYRKENRALGDQSVHHSMLLWKSLYTSCLLVSCALDHRSWGKRWGHLYCPNTRGVWYTD